MAMYSKSDAKDAATIFRLLRGATSLHVVRDFLRAKGLTHSAGTWDDVWARRLEPALEEEQLTVAELRDLLRSVEECGRQHVFWFSCEPERAKKLLSRRRIQSLLEVSGLESLLETPLELELPDSPRIVDVRFEPETPFERPSLVVKQVETRARRTFVRTEQHEDYEHRIYSLERRRAVNVVRLFEDGVLELRIASQDNLTRYHENLKTLFAAVAKIFPKGEFEPVSLQSAKDRLWEDRKTLAGKVRYANSYGRNDFGFGLQLTTSTQEDDLSTDDGSEAAMAAFLDNDGHVVGSNLYFVIPESDPVREVHVLLSGDVNEFAITAACSREDFEHVRRTIRALNS